jgi:predicted small lipoprotein YifL
MRMFKTLPALLLALSIVTGCQEKGPAEKAGQAVDRAAEKARDAVDPAGPVEKAGRAVDKAVDGK